jgi:hypothetical protein
MQQGIRVAADLQALIEALADTRTAFVVIGGVALVIHGSARTTQDREHDCAGATAAHGVGSASPRQFVLFQPPLKAR